MPREIASDHDNDHQHWRQDCVSGNDQTRCQEKHLHNLLGDGIQGVGQDALERYRLLLLQPQHLRVRLGQHNSGRRFATSVALETAIPICAWRSAGASLAPSPHMPTVCPLF